MSDTAPLPEPAYICWCIHAGEQQEPHPCPFLKDDLCTCCAECEDECWSEAADLVRECRYGVEHRAGEAEAWTAEE